MLRLCPTLSLSRTMHDEDEWLLVPSMRWRSLGSESGYHAIDARRALWMLRDLGLQRADDMRRFAAEIDRDIHRLDDQAILRLIGNAISDGRIIAVQKGAPETASSTATADLRRLVAEIEKATRGKLVFRGRDHKLVVDIDLGKVPGRSYYDVVSQSEARAVLDGIAKESLTAAGPLGKASERLSRDWRAPFSEPDGLILLRRIPVQAAAPRDEGPALTPSQMKELLQKDWVEVEVVDQDGEPFPTHYRLEATGNDIREGDLDEAGSMRVSDIVSGTCKLTLGEIVAASDAGAGADDATEEQAATQADEEPVSTTGYQVEEPGDGDSDGFFEAPEDDSAWWQDQHENEDEGEDEEGSPR